MGKKKKILPVLDRDKDSSLDWFEEDNKPSEVLEEAGTIVKAKKSVTKVPGKKRKFV